MMTTMVTPTIGYSHADPGMDGSKQTLIETTTKDTFEKIIVLIEMTQTITMSHKKLLTIYSHQSWFRVHDTTYLLLEIVEDPHIVITNKIMDFHPLISHLGQFTYETTEPSRHHVTIREPKIKHITQKNEAMTLWPYSIKQRHQLSFTLLAIEATAKMSIRYEIGIHLWVSG